MKEPYIVWLINMNKSYIFNNYNLDKVLTAKQLVELSKIYIDNEETIIVMMSKKKRPPQQPPQWFQEFVDDEFKPAISKLNSRIDNLESRLDNLVLKNNLKE